ncbi:MAG: alpha/beta hydrolase-fold protein, partial [Planctomycetota bacterium]
DNALVMNRIRHSLTSQIDPNQSPAGSDNSADANVEDDGSAGPFGSESLGLLECGRSPGQASRHAFLVPMHYEPKYQYPLIVWLHSDGFNEHQVKYVMPHISVRNFVAAGVRGVRAADTAGHRFDWSSSPAAIDAAQQAVDDLVDTAIERFSIHPDRVVLVGYRGGGSTALRLAMRTPGRYAAVVSLGGSMPSSGQTITDLNLLRAQRLPILWQWAVKGHHFQIDRMQADLKLANAIGAKVELRQYADDDEMNTVTLSDINDWIMRRVVAGQSSTECDTWPTAPVRFSSN